MAEWSAAAGCGCAAGRGGDADRHRAAREELASWAHAGARAARDALGRGGVRARTLRWRARGAHQRHHLRVPRVAGVLPRLDHPARAVPRAPRALLCLLPFLPLPLLFCSCSCSFSCTSNYLCRWSRSCSAASASSRSCTPPPATSRRPTCCSRSAPRSASPSTRCLLLAPHRSHVACAHLH